MSCLRVRSRFSAFLERDLTPAESGALASHLRECEGCAAELRELQGALFALRELPRQEPAGAVVAAVMDRIEVERRGPGLQLLFRPAWLARPLMVPSLLQGALVFASVLSLALALDRVATLRSDVADVRGGGWGAKPAPSGTEANPMLPSSGVSVPQLRNRGTMPEPFLEWQGEGNVFFETVVARDGSVSAVNLIGGDSEEARALADALLKERFEPARVGGRPVAVSVYRLFSRLVVRAHRT